MTLAATALLEIRPTAGSDTLCAGGFNVANANFATDGAISAANTASPVLSSASYNFVAGDVNAWAFLPNVANPGWYQIASVASNQATLNAAAGAAILYNSVGNPIGGPSTLVGCDSSASVSSKKWGVDYSQQNAAVVATNNLASSNGTTNPSSVTSSGTTFGVNHRGNYLQVTAGTSWTTGFYEIVTTSAGAATLDRAVGAAASLTAGTFAVGGALASIGGAGLAHVGGNYLALKGTGTNTVTSASTNIAGGCLSMTAGVAANLTRLVGFSSLRGDNGTMPLIQAGSISTFTLITAAAACQVENVSVDGVLKTSSTGITLNAAGGRALRCKVANCTNSALKGAGGSVLFELCEVTGCSTVNACTNGSYHDCVVHDNTVTGINLGTSGQAAVGCVVFNNTGGTTDGITVNGLSVTVRNCVIYGNGRHQINFTANAGTMQAVNCIAVTTAASSYCFTASAACDQIYLFNCAGWNNGGTAVVNNTVISPANVIGLITLTGTPFTNAAGNDFSLNNIGGVGIYQGAACRAAGIPAASGNYALPGGSTASYPDLGAAQHAGNLVPLIFGA